MTGRHRMSLLARVNTATTGRVRFLSGCCAVLTVAALGSAIAPDATHPTTPPDHIPRAAPDDPGRRGGPLAPIFPPATADQAAPWDPGKGPLMVYGQPLTGRRPTPPTPEPAQRPVADTNPPAAPAPPEPAAEPATDQPAPPPPAVEPNPAPTIEQPPTQPEPEPPAPVDPPPAAIEPPVIEEPPS